MDVRADCQPAQHPQPDLRHHLQKRIFPDRQWCLYAMMELEPSSEIFKASYNPKAARVAHDVEIEPLAGLMEGIR